MQRLIVITALASALTWLSASAQDAPNGGDNEKDAVLELTIALIPADAQTPAAVTATIELPKNESTGAYIPSEQAVERSAQGLGTANAAREDGRAFGEAMAAEARENRENASRASRDGASSQLPAPPETPDPAQPPAR